MTVIMLFLAYVLPLPILGACLYFHLYENMDAMSRLIAIGLTSVAPSALLMIFVIKRVVHLVFNLVLIGAVIFGLYHFGLIGQPAH